MAIGYAIGPIIGGGLAEKVTWRVRNQLFLEAKLPDHGLFAFSVGLLDYYSYFSRGIGHRSRGPAVETSHWGYEEVRFINR